MAAAAKGKKCRHCEGRFRAGVLSPISQARYTEGMNVKLPSDRSLAPRAVKAIAPAASIAQPHTKTGGLCKASSNAANPARMASPCSTTPKGARSERSRPINSDIVTIAARSQTGSPDAAASSTSGASTSSARRKIPPLISAFRMRGAARIRALQARRIGSPWI